MNTTTIGQIPQRAFSGHPKMAEVGHDLKILEGVFQGVARSGLSPKERCDLAMLEADAARARNLQADLRAIAAVAADPKTPVSELKRLVSDRVALDECNTEIARLVKDLRSENVTVFSIADNGVMADLKWVQNEVSPAMQAQGFTGVLYTARGTLGAHDFEIDAKPLTSDTRDGHYMKLRAAVSEDEHRWSGEEMTFGNADGYLSTRFTPMGLGSENLSHHEGGDIQKWSAADEAFATQVLDDMGVGWLVPAKCKECW